MVLRADSGFYSSKVTQACAKAEVSYSVTVRTSKALHKVIAAIEEEDWTPIPYWIDDGAEVAETTYRPFSPKHPEVRLIVRRVKPTPGSQLALFSTYDYHAFITVDRHGIPWRCRHGIPLSGVCLVSTRSCLLAVGFGRTR